MEMDFMEYKIGFHYENDRLYYMTHVTQGAHQRHFILWLGVSSGRRESESLVVFLFEKLYFTKSHCICRYLDL